MKYKTQMECMDKKCNTVIVGPENRLDGISCPRCNGPVFPKPFIPQKKVSEDALYVRGKIIEYCHKHCFDLTPEQVDTVLDIYKDKLFGLTAIEFLQEFIKNGKSKSGS